jgi:hypothetical protein
MPDRNALPLASILLLSSATQAATVWTRIRTSLRRACGVAVGAWGVPRLWVWQPWPAGHSVSKRIKLLVSL